MRKSNWIVYIVVLVVSAFLLWLWYWLGFDHVDAPLDLVLSIIWWIGVALAAYAIYRVEKKRRMRRRTCFLRTGLLYNTEAGTRGLASADADTAVDAMHDVIDNLEYDFAIQDRPEDSEGNLIEFSYVVRSEKFDIERREDEENDTPEEIDWRGEVAIVARPDDDPIPFENIDDLRAIMRNLFAATAVSMTSA